jgi:hypothetical protein
MLVDVEPLSGQRRVSSLLAGGVASTFFVVAAPALTESVST